MAPQKRSLTVIGIIAVAAFALTACAPAGYNAADYNNGPIEPAANEAAAAEPSGSAAPEDESEGAEDAADETGDADAKLPKLTDEQITTELKAVSVKRMGQTVQDEDGWVLYRFDGDKAEPEPESTCNGECAKVWPPVVILDAKPKLAGVEDSEVGTVQREDGTTQLTIGDWPVYRYIGDKAPGKWSGQNVGGKWFVVNPDGTKNLTCLPKISQAVAPPADADESDDEEGASDYTY